METNSVTASPAFLFTSGLTFWGKKRVLCKQPCWSVYLRTFWRPFGTSAVHFSQNKYVDSWHRRTDTGVSHLHESKRRSSRYGHVRPLKGKWDLAAAVCVCVCHRDRAGARPVLRWDWAHTSSSALGFWCGFVVTYLDSLTVITIFYFFHTGSFLTIC